MQHWRALEIRMLELDYERLAADPEPVARELIASLGLDWDPACLRFHETKTAVLTASHAQVREPAWSNRGSLRPPAKGRKSLRSS